MFKDYDDAADSFSMLEPKIASDTVAASVKKEWRSMCASVSD